MANALRLSRNQIAQIVGNDPEATKQFERLFALAENNLNNGQVDDSSRDAGTAISLATDALAQLALLGGDVSPAFPDLSPIVSRLDALEAAPIPQAHVNRLAYGSFFDTTDQTAAVANTAYGVTFNSTGLSNGVTIGSPTSRILVDRPNVYRIDVSLQAINAGGANHHLWCWLAKNGTAIANTTRAFRLPSGSTELAATAQHILELNAGDYIEVMWEVGDTSVSLNYEAATGVHPATPSAMVNVTDNIQGK